MGQARNKPSREEEQALIADCQRGDPASWQRLYEQYRQDAWRILARTLGPSDELEDLVQKVFIKVHRSLGRFEGRSRFTTWLYRICVHVAMDHLRAKRRRREVADLESVREPVDPAADPSAPLAHRQAADRINRALSKLKEEKRTVIVLHDIMEIPAEEIAQSLGIPAGTVRTRLFYGRRELARLLAKQREQG